MLNILLFILKIIGFILAAILGILVLLICIALFVPFRYKVWGESKGNLDSTKLDFRGSWLLHLVSVTAAYREKEIHWRLRVLWLKWSGDESADGERKNQSEKGVDIYEDDKVEQEETIQEKAETVEKTDEVIQSIETETCEGPGLPEKIEKRTEKAEEETGKKHSSILEKIKGLFGKIKDGLQKIKCTIIKFCDRIKMLLEKKERLAEFIEDETHRNAFSKVRAELFCLIGKLKPSKLTADIHFGFGDPCLTGQVLAVLSVLYPWLGGHTNILPDFEEKVLEGTLLVKGRVRGSYFCVLALRLLLSKSVRTTYRHVIKFRE